MQEALLSVQNLKTYFRTPDGLARAVDGISFDIAPNEIFALVGESGCGKSVTALSVIQLVAQPAGFIAGGAIYYKGQDITRLPEVELVFLTHITTYNNYSANGGFRATTSLWYSRSR